MEPVILKTRDGGNAVVFNTVEGARRCYIGAYSTGEKWIPCDWLRDGRWHDKLGYPRGLDLILPKENNNKTAIG